MLPIKAAVKGFVDDLQNIDREITSLKAGPCLDCAEKRGAIEVISPSPWPGANP